MLVSIHSFALSDLQPSIVGLFTATEVDQKEMMDWLLWLF